MGEPSVTRTTRGRAALGQFTRPGRTAPRAYTPVREAFALMVNSPGGRAAIAAKIDAALRAEDTPNVQIPLVRQAKDVLAAGDLHQAQRLLEQAIGAQVDAAPAEPVPIITPAAEGQPLASGQSRDAAHAGGQRQPGRWRSCPAAAASPAGTARLRHAARRSDGRIHGLDRTLTVRRTVA